MAPVKEPVKEPFIPEGMVFRNVSSRASAEVQVREYLRNKGKEGLFTEGMIDLFLTNERMEEARLARWRPKHLVRDKNGDWVVKETSKTGYVRRMTRPQ